MSRAPMESVVSHWSKLVVDYYTSPSDFYTALEAALERHQLKQLRTERVEWSEGGVLTPNRQYLRVSGPRHDFDICASHFGADFFFSSWVTKRQPRWVLLHLAALVLCTLSLAWLLQFLLTSIFSASSSQGLMFVMPLLTLVLGPLVLIPVSFFVILAWVAMAARAGTTDSEEAICAAPLLGWIYVRIFAPETYYRVDTMLMFQSAVHTTMLEVIDGLMAQKGLRVLTESERKPVFKELVLREHEPEPALR